MKKYILPLLIIGVLVGCEILFNENENVGYDIEKDKMVNRALDSKNISFYISQNSWHTDSIFYISTDSLRITVIYSPKIDFTQPLEWHISGNEKDGRLVLMDIRNLHYMNRISPQTYNRIIEMVQDKIQNK